VAPALPLPFLVGAVLCFFTYGGGGAGAGGDRGGGVDGQGVGAPLGSSGFWSTASGRARCTEQQQLLASEFEPPKGAVGVATGKCHVDVGELRGPAMHAAHFLVKSNSNSLSKNQ
jgi:hypothetical protein